MKFNNTKRGRTFYKNALNRRASRLVAAVAREIYGIQVPSRGPEDNMRPIWSGYFRANWNVNIGEPDDTVFGKRKSWPPRYEYVSQINLDKAEQSLGELGRYGFDLADSVYVTNPVWYGPLLLHGVFNSQTGALTPGRDFIALATEHIRENLSSILHTVRKQERRD